MLSDDCIHRVSYVDETRCNDQLPRAPIIARFSC